MLAKDLETGSQLYFANDQGVFAPIIVNKVYKQNISQGFITIETVVNSETNYFNKDVTIQSNAVSRFHIPANHDMYFINLLSTHGYYNHIVISNDIYPVSFYLYLIAENFTIEAQRGFRNNMFSESFVNEINYYATSIQELVYKVNKYKPLIPKQLRGLNSGVYIAN
jgi:hypothetical protein